MIQSKKFSLYESTANTTIGLACSYLVQMMIFPLLGISISHSTNLKITMIFFIVSFARGYLIRRFFNRVREWKK